MVAIGFFGYGEGPLVIFDEVGERLMGAVFVMPHLFYEMEVRSIAIPRRDVDSKATFFCYDLLLLSHRPCLVDYAQRRRYAVAAGALPDRCNLGVLSDSDTKDTNMNQIRLKRPEGLLALESIATQNDRFGESIESLVTMIIQDIDEGLVKSSKDVAGSPILHQLESRIFDRLNIINPCWFTTHPTFDSCST